MIRNAIIIGSGSYVPERVVTNQWFNSILGEDVDTWLKEYVQIYERRWCAENESTADLVEKACEIALIDAGISVDKINLLIVGTDTPEYISPSTASVIQNRLGLINAATFDINTACAGFVTALDIGSKYIQSDSDYEYVMIVGAYAMSKHLNILDKKTVTLFADGAGAVILGNTNTARSGFQGSKLFSNGQYNESMGIYGGGSKFPMTHDRIDKKIHQLQFVKKIPSEVNPDIWTGLVHDVCHKAGLSCDDIDHFFFTQINISSIGETMKRLKVPMEKAATIMHKYGYTGSACIPMAFDQWRKSGKVKTGDTVIFVGSGGGLAFGACLFKI